MKQKVLSPLLNAADHASTLSRGFSLGDKSKMLRLPALFCYFVGLTILIVLIGTVSFTDETMTYDAGKHASS